MNISGKKLLIIGGAYQHCKIVEAAKELGVYTIVTDYLEPNDSPAKQIADEYWMINIMDIDALEMKCRQEHIDGVLAFCIDPTQIPYQKLAERLGLPCFGTKEIFDIFTNKRLFKDYCRKHNVDVIPEYSEEDINENKIKYPILIKPDDSRGSRGITVCYNKEDVKKAIDIAKNESKNGRFIIEKYMYGCKDMAFAYMIIDSNPYLVKIGDRIVGEVADNLQCQQMATILPSNYTNIYINNINDTIINMIKSTGMKFGAIFLQGFFENGKVYMYDPGLRFPGSNFDIATKKITGFDSMKAFVEYAITGNVKSCYGDPNKAYNYNGGTCIIFSISCRSGKISTISGIDVISNDNRIIDVGLRYNVGDIVPSTGDVRQRVAEFVAFLPNKNDISSFIDFIYNKVKILDDNGNDMIISKIKCPIL